MDIDNNKSLADLYGEACAQYNDAGLDSEIRFRSALLTLHEILQTAQEVISTANIAELAKNEEHSRLVGRLYHLARFETEIGEWNSFLVSIDRLAE